MSNVGSVCWLCQPHMWAAVIATRTGWPGGRRRRPPPAAGGGPAAGKFFCWLFFPHSLRAKRRAESRRRWLGQGRRRPQDLSVFVGFRRFSSVLVRLVCFFSLSWGTLVATVTFFSRAWRSSLACAFENPFCSAARAFGLSARCEWELGPGVGAAVVACEWF